ncbi:MAG: hypothetical protein AUI14_10675 [Actinobacteria bacterium 13_2_20CM_2_71_6]|nr:MAG: hypothetical protein AUI14_10675 [Actinobacteria bacterium 13_2_20CM_2_71_6]
MEFLVALVTAFVLVVPVELPDKTFVATLVLATRYPPGPVWIGVTVAFGIQSLVAVLAGRLVSLLPERPVHLVAAGLFAVGAILLARSARRAAIEEREREKEFERKVGYGKRSGVQAALASFGLLFVSAAAVLLGRVLIRYVSLTLVQYVGAAVCGVLAVLTVVGVF